LNGLNQLQGAKVQKRAERGKRKVERDMIKELIILKNVRRQHFFPHSSFLFPHKCTTFATENKRL
jgi:hypothetical protein